MTTHEIILTVTKSILVLEEFFSPPSLRKLTGITAPERVEHLTDHTLFFTK